MIPSTDRDRLLEDALMPESLAGSLAAVRRAASRRRARVRTVRATAAVCVVLGAAWFFHWMPHIEPPQRTGAGGPEAPRPFILVTSGTQPTSSLVRTVAVPASLIVTTAPVMISPVSEDELFASAGERPGGLVHLADGTARWMWLDVPEME